MQLIYKWIEKINSLYDQFIEFILPQKVNLKKIRRDYYEEFIFPKTIDKLSVFINSDLQLKSKVEIKFKNIDFGIYKNDFIKEHGKPKYSFKQRPTDKNTYDILFYKDQITEFKFIAQYHFVNNQLFFISTTYISVPKHQIETLKSFLSKKYFSESDSFQLSDFSDFKNNKIFTKDDVNFHLSYLSGDTYLVNKILELPEENKKSEPVMKIKDMFSYF